MANDNAAPDAAEIAAIREMLDVCEKDNPGPWHKNADEEWVIRDNENSIVAPLPYSFTSTFDFILHAPAFERSLLATIEAQAARIAALESENATLRKLWTTKQRWEP